MPFLFASTHLMINYFDITTKLKSFGNKLRDKFNAKCEDLPGTLYYTPDVTKLHYKPFEIADEGVRSFFKHFADAESEHIVRAWIWKQNLVWWFPKWFGAWHEFTMIQSTNWYWSFESCSDGIRVQRGKDFGTLKHCYRGVRRTGNVVPEGREDMRGQPEETMQYIFVWIYNRNFLNGKYHLRHSNCHNFASFLFEAVTRRICMTHSNVD